MKYFKDSKIKMRQINPDTNKHEDMEDLNSEEFDEEIKQSQSQGQEANDNKGVTVSRSGRRRVPVAGAQAAAIMQN